MNKNQLIDTVSKNIGEGMKKQDVKNVIVETLNVIEKTMLDGEEIALTGLGTFKQKISKERTCRNPQTGLPITVPAKKNVKWKTAKKLVDLMNS